MRGILVALSICGAVIVNAAATESPQQIRELLRSRDPYKDRMPMIAEDAIMYMGGAGKDEGGHTMGNPMRKRWLAELSQLYDIVNIDVWNKSLIGEHLDTGGKYYAWSELADHPEAAAPFFAQVNERIRDCHDAGMTVLAQIASHVHIRPERFGRGTQPHQFESGFPGVQDADLKRHPEFRGMVADPDTKKFVPVNALDWCNPSAVDYCLKQFAWVCRQMKGVDYWTLSEEAFGFMHNHPRSGLDDDWYVLPVFSDAALADFRHFVGDPAARMPSPKGFPPTDRTFNTPTAKDWTRWIDWMRDVHARFFHARAKVAYEANRDNPRYLGVVLQGDVGTMYEPYSSDRPALATRSPYVTMYVIEKMVGGSKKAWHEHQAEVRDWIAAIKGNGAKYAYWMQSTLWGQSYPPAASEAVRLFRQHAVVSQFQEGLRLGADVFKSTYCGHMLPSSPTVFRGWAGSYVPEVAQVWRILRKRYVLKQTLTNEEAGLLARCERYSRNRPTVAATPIAQAVQIDGSLKEWPEIRAIEMGEEAASPEGRGRWKPDLLSGKLRFQYDASHLYIALQVQAKAPATVCFKLAFCPYDDEADLTPNHIVYFYLPADPAKPGPWNARVDGLTKSGGRIGFQELPAGAGYTIEVQTPLAAIRKGWMPTPGRRLPISIQLDECERSLYSHWLPQETCDPSRPTTWGALEFMAGPTGPTRGKSKP